MSPSKVAEVDPETAVAVLTQKADLARAQIRGLVNSLPDNEAESILDILDNPPQKEETEQSEDFVWDKLPAEVKNIIYRFVFVADKPIKPHIYWPNVPHRRYISKFGLGAGFLRCSKAIYAEANPILRMENTFELGTQFRVCLGEDRGKRNSSLIRKVFLRPEKLSWTIHALLSRLDNKDELTIADRSPFTRCDDRASAENSAATAFVDAESRLWHGLSLSFFLGQFSKVYYVAERELKGRDYAGNNRIAFRFSVVRNLRPAEEGKVDDEENLWSVRDFDLKIVACNEYRSKTWSDYPRV